jgi:hypothetical protein
MSNTRPPRARPASPLDLGMDTPKYHRKRHSFLKLASIQVPASPSRDMLITSESTIEQSGTQSSRPKHWGWDSGTSLSKSLPPDGSLASRGSCTAFQDTLQHTNSRHGSLISWDDSNERQSPSLTDSILYSRKQAAQPKLSMLPPSRHQSLSRRE